MAKMKTITALNLKDMEAKWVVLIEELPKGTPYHNDVTIKNKVVKTSRSNKRYDGVIVMNILCENNYFTTDYTIYVPEDYKFKEATKAQRAKNDKFIQRNAVARAARNLYKIAGRVGSDPEIFCTDCKGRLLPAFEFLKGKNDKDVDMTNGVSRYQESNKVYWDGFQAEFETAPDTCLSYHVDSIRLGMKRVLELARKKDKDAKLSIQTVFNVNPDVLEATDEKYVQLGCMPSKNAYKLKAESCKDGRAMTVRSAGGHIHLELDAGEKKHIPEYVKALDAILGVACVSLFQNYDNPERRRFYGRAGEYRTPPHGMEYRVLSNAWLIHPLITNICFDLSRMCVSAVKADLMKNWKAKPKEIIDCINNCDVKKAQALLTRNEAMFKAILTACYKGLTTEHIDKLFDIFMKGMDSVLTKTDDIESNWMLTNGNWVGHNDGKEQNVRESANIIVAGKKVS